MPKLSEPVKPTRLDEIELWNRKVRMQREIKVNAETVLLNLVPARMWNNTISKEELRKQSYLIGKWKRWQTELCDRKISFNKVCFFVTGLIPQTQFQMIILDIDVTEKVFCEHILALASWIKDVKAISMPFRINATNSGFHLFYLCDNSYEIRNIAPHELNSALKIVATWLSKIDVRGTGGFAFAPPSQFRGGHAYETLWANSVHINRSEKFLEMLQ